MDLDIFTIAEPVQVVVSGGNAVILNPVTMTVMDNGAARDSEVVFEPGTQFMLVGSSDKGEVWLVLVSEAGDFYDEETTYGVVLRRGSFEKLQAAAILGASDEDFSDWSQNISKPGENDDFEGDFYGDNGDSIPSVQARPSSSSSFKTGPARPVTGPRKREL